MQTRVFAYILFFGSIEVIFRLSRLQRHANRLLKLSLCLQDVDFVMKSIIYFLLFAQI